MPEGRALFCVAPLQVAWVVQNPGTSAVLVDFETIVELSSGDKLGRVLSGSDPSHDALSLSIRPDLKVDSGLGSLDETLDSGAIGADASKTLLDFGVNGTDNLLCQGLEDCQVLVRGLGVEAGSTDSCPIETWSTLARTARC